MRRQSPQIPLVCLYPCTPYEDSYTRTHTYAHCRLVPAYPTYAAVVIDMTDKTEAGSRDIDGAITPPYGLLAALRNLFVRHTRGSPYYISKSYPYLYGTTTT